MSESRDPIAAPPDREIALSAAYLRLLGSTQAEAAYRRTDLFERRRRLMDDWAAYLAGER